MMGDILMRHAHWYWVVGGDASRAWSSAACAYVTNYPAEFASHVADENAIRQALAAAGCPERAPNYVPPAVTMAQARVALRRAGLIDAVQAAVDAAGGEVADAWEYSATVSRESALVLALSAALNLSPETLDALFTEAAQITF